MVHRKTAFTFIMIASFVLLVHAVLPHHHHDQQIFLNESTCCNHSGQQHYCHGHNHQHDDQGNEENCVLKQLVILPATQEKFKTENFVPAKNINHASFCLIQEIKLHDVFQNCTYISFIHYPFDDGNQLDSNSGLRAPPVA